MLSDVITYQSYQLNYHLTIAEKHLNPTLCYPLPTYLVATYSTPSKKFLLYRTIRLYTNNYIYPT